MIQTIKALKQKMVAAGFNLAAADRLHENSCKLVFVSAAGVQVEMTVTDISENKVALAAILEAVNG